MKDDKMEMTPEAFDKLAKQLGLTLDSGERERLFEGYKGLQSLLARLPDDPDMADEPATVFLGSSTRIVR